MSKGRILFVTQEITPYLKESHMANIGRFLPQGIQEMGKEIRTFMPRFGNINERRNQLHEVIRLSGMNLIINDQDHPLIIKVASIQSASCLLLNSTSSFLGSILTSPFSSRILSQPISS